MAWSVDLTRSAVKQVKKLDPATARRILTYLDDTARAGSPRQRGKALTGPYGGLWRYRVGDYRIICDLKDEKLIILALTIKHRSTVYKDLT